MNHDLNFLKEIYRKSIKMKGREEENYDSNMLIISKCWMEEDFAVI